MCIRKKKHQQRGEGCSINSLQNGYVFRRKVIFFAPTQFSKTTSKCIKKMKMYGRFFSITRSEKS